MDGADVIIGHIGLPALGGNARDGFPFAVDGLGTVAGENAAAVFLDKVTQGLGEEDAAAGETAGAVNVQDRDKGVDVGRRHLGPAAVQRIQIGHHAAQVFILDAIDYNDSFLTALAEAYPRLPEPRDDYPIEMAPATPTDLTGAEPQGTLWCLGFGPEENCDYQPFITADPLFLFGNNTVSLNAEAKDVNGAAPAFAGQVPALPAFELPAVQ